MVKSGNKHRLHEHAGTVQPLLKVGVIGSAFNPPHLGHKDIIEQVYQDFDEILLVPSYRHAFAKQMVRYEHRLHMASMLAAAFHGEPHLHYSRQTPLLVSDIERTIGQQSKSPVYTYDVLHALEQRYRNAGFNVDLSFIIGPDNASHATWQRFYRSDDIRRRWQVRSVSERLTVHSSQIRGLIASYPRPKFLFVNRFKRHLDEMIAQYIFDNGLYGIH